MQSPIYRRRLSSLPPAMTLAAEILNPESLRFHLFLDLDVEDMEGPEPRISK